MRAFINIARYLLMVAVWLLSATFIVCLVYFLIGKVHPLVTSVFLKEYAVMLGILIVVFYFVNLIFRRNEEEGY
jgi:hypothetical protein